MLNKNDWRLTYQDEYLLNAELKKLNFWKNSKKQIIVTVLFVGKNSVKEKWILAMVIVLKTADIGFARNVIAILRIALISS